MTKTRIPMYWRLLATIGAGTAVWLTVTACDEAASTVSPSCPCPGGAGNSGATTTPASAKGPSILHEPMDAKADAAPFDPALDNARRMIEEGRETFRFETFGDEAFWGDTLKLHRAIAGEASGGVGPGLSPKAALAAGLKVDATAIPADVVTLLNEGKVDLDDPKSTLLLLKLNAVVGVKGFFDKDALKSVGIECALCHSTVDDSFAPGIGIRMDGSPNRDLNIGEIVSMAPDLNAIMDLLGVNVATVKAVLASWGPGKFDAEVFLDGKGQRPDGKTAATLIPPAYGLAGVNLHTYTGWGSITYWNAFVANLEMHGKGSFFDPRLENATRFPIAKKAGMGRVRKAVDDDRITPKLASLHFYQLALEAPKPEPGTFDAEAAQRGADLFAGKAKCASCHVPPLFTEPGWNMHAPEEIGIDDFQAQRSPDQRYRTTPLRGVSSHSKGGFYHDGRFATLRDVVDHYDTIGSLGLIGAEKNDVVEYLKSL